VETWIQLGRGPLFRAALALLVLGLLRVVALSLVELVEAYRRSSDRTVNWREVAGETLGWLVPLGRLWRQRPVYSTISVLFHAGLLIVPIFLAAHVSLWKRALAVAWPALPQTAANVLTLVVIVTGLGLFLSRVAVASGRQLSRAQDFAWPLLLIAPFVTGYVCANLAIGAQSYEAFMLVHVYSVDLILVLIPFTQIAHCVLAPFSQVVSAIAWKFPPGAGDRIAETLGHAESRLPPVPSGTESVSFRKKVHAP
jgi:nitrate reductase gamma subunit